MDDPADVEAVPNTARLWRRVRMRPLESYSRVILGGMAILVISVSIGAALTVKSMGMGFTRYTAEFLQAASLAPGDYVSYAGIPVGNVTSVRLVGDHVEVRMRVRDGIQLRENARAAIKMTTVLGSQYVELRNAGEGQLSNRTIDLSRTEVPYDLQQTLSDSATTFEQVDAESIASSLTVLTKQLRGLPEVIPQAMQNIQTLSSVMARRRSQLGTLLSSTEKLTNTLHGQQQDIGKMITEGRDLLGEFVTRQESFHVMMQAIGKLVDMLRKVTVEDRAALDALIVNTKKFTDLLGQHDDLFRDILQVMAVSSRNATNALGTGNALDLYAPNGILIDSWMCAIAGRAKQFNLPEYFKDCR